MDLFDIDLKKTKDGIYYIYNYVPVRRQKRADDAEVQLSNDLLDYKDGKQEAMDRFTSDLQYAVATLSRKSKRKNIGLMAVPSSTVGHESTVCKSISRIYTWSYLHPFLRIPIDEDKKIYDYSNYLIRTSNVQKAAKARRGKRPTVEDHINSISVSKETPLWKYRTAFIIIDDITTTGTIMQACRQILLNHGAKEEDIICLALAKTI